MQKYTDMSYVEYGTGMPILMLHGYHVDHRLMTGCMEPIFETHPGYRRIYPDLPGMGMTPASADIHCSDQMLDAVVQFIEHIIPEGPFLVAGASYGGYMARGVVNRLSERVAGVFLICPVIYAIHADRDCPAHEVFESDPELLASIPEEEREGFAKMLVIQNRLIWERYEKEILSGVHVADSSFLDKLQKEGYAYSFDVDKLSHPYEKPTLILLGKQDFVVGYKDAHKLLEIYPHATYTILDRAGHNLFLEKPAVFEALTLEWLDRVEKSMNLVSVG